LVPLSCDDFDRCRSAECHILLKGALFNNWGLTTSLSLFFQWIYESMRMGVANLLNEFFEGGSKSAVRVDGSRRTHIALLCTLLRLGETGEHWSPWRLLTTIICHHTLPQWWTCASTYTERRS
jgi:hypothetical protein